MCKCKTPNTCEAFVQKCRRPGTYLESCHASRPCGDGFSCQPGWQKCFHKPRILGEPCSAGCECKNSLSCHPGVQKCYNHPRRLHEPCSLGYACAKGLDCQPGVQRCYHASRKYLEPCSLFHKCVNGFTCHPGIQRCYHNPRRYKEPCVSFFACDKGLSCQPGIHRCFRSPRQKEEPCSLGHKCDKGLWCSICSSEFATCRAGRVTPLMTGDYGRPFNEISFLVTHNSYSYGTDFGYWVHNQVSDIGKQLEDGVRGFMLDIFPGWGTDDVRLCHRTCTWGGSRSLSESLLVIRRFLDNNPTEVVIIIFEDYVRSPGKLRKILDQADLTRHVLPVKFWGSANHSWPTLTEMKTLGRLVVFSNAAVHGFPYTGVTMWNYVRENRYGNPSRNQKECEDRFESKHNMYSKDWSLVLVNWFRTISNPLDFCLNDQTVIQAKLETCTDKFGQLPNFLTVDYYEYGKHGGAFRAVDWLNEQWRKLRESR